ncbi:MAG TPA: O-antigen ligase family protein, partial [Candidatus Saccharimonadales bacterium]|nr:O-antigen ligase family protein [Candidatus Saccharimonadales bacterium]
DRWSGTLLFAFATFFGVAVLAYLFGLQTQDGFRFLGRYLRFLFIAPVVLTFRRYPPTTKTVFIGLALGALAGGLGSVWYFLQVRRINGMEAATDLHIIFGDLATTMVLCTVAGFGLIALSRRAWSLPVLFLSVAGGIAASIISGARGAWIALLLLPLLLLMPLNDRLKRRYIFAVVLVLVAVCALFYLVAGRAAQERVKGIVSKLDNYSVSLHYLELAIGSSLSHPVCMPKLEFLEAWAHAGYGVEGAPRITVVSDPVVGVTPQCKLDYAVKIHNFSRKQNAQIIFPRYAANLGGDHKTQLMARGAGGLSFAYESTATVMISSAGYERAVLAAHGGLGNEINVYIAPGKTVWVVPLESHIGEFGMSVADNSVGNRLEMWRAAWMLFLSHPLLGVGTGAYQPSTDRLIAEGKIMPTIASYDHPHNDYLNALAS